MISNQIASIISFWENPPRLSHNNSVQRCPILQCIVWSLSYQGIVIKRHWKNTQNLIGGGIKLPVGNRVKVFWFESILVISYLNNSSSKLFIKHSKESSGSLFPCPFKFFHKKGYIFLSLSNIWFLHLKLLQCYP